MRRIAETVAETLAVGVEAMQSEGRGLAESSARAVAMALAASLHPKWDPKDIAGFFKRPAGDARSSSTRVSTAIRRNAPTKIGRDARAVCTRMQFSPERLTLDI